MAGRRAIPVPADADVELIVIDVGQAVIGECLRQLGWAKGGQLFGGNQPVAAATPERMRVYLPLSAGVVGFGFLHRLIGIAFATVCLWLAQQKCTLASLRPF